MMKTIAFPRFSHYLLLMVSGLVLMCTANTSFAQNDPNLIKTIQKMNQEFIKFFQGGDAAPMEKLYCSDAQLLPPGAPPITGVEQILGVWQTYMNAGLDKVDLTTVSAEKCGNKVIEQGTYTIWAGNNMIIDQGKYIVIWKKENGRLKIYRDITNSNNPPPPARAQENDTIFFIYDHVKAEMVKEFENFNIKYLKPVAQSLNSSRSTRFLQKVTRNEDGTYTFAYLIDPMNAVANTPMLKVLVDHYGEEKGREYYAIYAKCLVKTGADKYVVLSVW